MSLDMLARWCLYVGLVDVGEVTDSIATLRASL